MEPQSYAKHAKFVPLYHQVLFGLIVHTFIGSLINMYETIGDHSRLYNSALITAAYAGGCDFVRLLQNLPAQGPESRHLSRGKSPSFRSAGKLLDPRLNVKQIVALRFASDGEFVELARRAADQNLAPGAIKQAVKTWRADHDRL